MKQNLPGQASPPLNRISLSSCLILSCSVGTTGTENVRFRIASERSNYKNGGNIKHTHLLLSARLRALNLAVLGSGCWLLGGCHCVCWVCWWSRGRFGWLLIDVSWRAIRRTVRNAWGYTCDVLMEMWLSAEWLVQLCSALFSSWRGRLFLAGHVDDLFFHHVIILLSDWVFKRSR